MPPKIIFLKYGESPLSIKPAGISDGFIVVVAARGTGGAGEVICGVWGAGEMADEVVMAHVDELK
jgi:hypothetical protein